MIQGTTSDAGKSVMVAALCRILARQGISVAPFKSQNMALNSAVTADGGEIGRAQAVQAEACYLEPTTDMNPVLLKPNTDVGAQVIVNGKSIGNMEADFYHQYKPKILQLVIDAHHRLAAKHGVVIVEGAGSPAEINLRDRDIANMGFAEAVDCPVIIVADIDRGGVFAHLVGTLELLSESEQHRVVGFIINRFRGDIALLQSGLDWLEERTGKPVLAVIPYLENLHIEAEDAIAREVKESTTNALKIRVPVYPRISNHTDFDALRHHPSVDLQFTKDPQQCDAADLIILPGTKNVRNDYHWLVESGWKSKIEQHLRYGGKVIGICGGFQMLGNMVHDPEGIESEAGSTPTLGLLDFQTTLQRNKTLLNVQGECARSHASVRGYEIHAGSSHGPALEQPAFLLGDHQDGTYSEDDRILGTYIHGVFDSPDLRQYLLQWAGLSQAVEFDYLGFRNREINRLADAVEAVLPIDIIGKLVDLQPRPFLDQNQEEN